MTPANLDSAYLQNPRIITTPGKDYQAAGRAFQGIPSLACGTEGRRYSVWYGGRTPGEDQNNYVVLVASTDSGQHWSKELLAVDPDGPGPVRAFDPEIWRAPNGQLWLFWAQGVGHVNPDMRNGVWAMTADESQGVNARWSVPRRLCDGVMMCKPLALSSGAWALPVSLWHRREGASAAMFVSEDAGATWTERGACDIPPEVRSHDEHMLVEKHNGDIWLLVRTRYGIGESFSRDGGKTWSPLQPSGIPHAVTRFFIRRLISGRLLLVRHDPGEGYFAGQEHPGGIRSHLAAFLSDDDGRSWSHRLLLDERPGVSYPDGDQDETGKIYIAYDFERTKAREILMAEFTEDQMTRPAASKPPVVINKAGLSMVPKP